MGSSCPRVGSEGTEITQVNGTRRQNLVKDRSEELSGVVVDIGGRKVGVIAEESKGGEVNW